MTNKTIFSLIYIILVIVNGLMTISNNTFLSALFIELGGGLALAISIYFFQKKKKFFIFIVPALFLMLTIFYGYDFSKTNGFYSGLLTVISAFLLGGYIIEIINYYGRMTQSK